MFCGILPLSGPSTLTVGQTGSYNAGYAISCVNNEAPQECNGVQSGTTYAIWQWSGGGSVVTIQGSSDESDMTALGSSPGTANLTVTAANDTCYFGETAPVTVTPACPSSITVGPVTQFNLSSFPADVPSPLSTGIGIVTPMKVGPTSTNWYGTAISESLSAGSNSCPASWTPACTGSATFTVGYGGTAVAGGVTLGNFNAVENQFYDQHTTTNPQNILGVAGIQTCTTVCHQSYSCKGTVIGSFTITRTYTRGTVGSSAVTNVGVTKQ